MIFHDDDEYTLVRRTMKAELLPLIGKKVFHDAFASRVDTCRIAPINREDVFSPDTVASRIDACRIAPANRKKVFP
ncbi:hypothetical protein TNCV_12371 [Trichonephila clavipes]|nr:hypothetical protein TNCV_12371 [Trichonephila clavipes]